MSSEIVTVASGRLEGKRQGPVTAFLGVPYAWPPVGELRFRAPRPPAPWTGVRKATRFGPAAPQFVGSRLVGRTAGEDCLYLNIWTPGARTESGRGRPVMVWLHGGGFFLGAGSRFLYSGRTLAETGDVVVVTLNYRLGALGFLHIVDPGRPDHSTANLGLRDQIAALEWVRENIGAFGGDPNRVTVFGESAGAMSIGTLLGAGTGLFHRAILESGAAANVSTETEAREVTEIFLRALGQSTPDVDALRKMELGRILAAQRTVFREAAQRRFGRLPWQPSIDGDLLERMPIESIRSGAASDIDVLIGTNRDEWRLFSAGALNSRWMRAKGLERRVAEWLERRGVDPVAAPRVIDAYRRELPGEPNAYEIWSALRTDEFFRLPAVELARLQSSRQARTFMYRFDFPIPALPRSLGACHAGEVPLVFGSFRHPLLKPVYLESRRAARLATVLQQAWSAFAREGVPAADNLPEWQPFSPERPQTMILADPCRLEPVPPDPKWSLWLDSTPYQS